MVDLSIETVGDRLQFQLAAAVGTDRPFSFLLLGLPESAAYAVSPDQPISPAAMQPDQPTDSFQLQFAIGAHESVVADFLKAAGQDVLHEAADELLTGGVSRYRTLAAAGCHPVSDPCGIDVHDPVVADRHAVDVRRQVLQHRLAVADRFDIDDPVLFQHAVRQLPVQTGFLQLADEILFVKLDRRERMKQLIGRDLSPAFAVGTDPSAGNDEVHVRMISSRVAAPGVQVALSVSQSRLQVRVKKNLIPEKATRSEP